MINTKATTITMPFRIGCNQNFLEVKQRVLTIIRIKSGQTKTMNIPIIISFGEDIIIWSGMVEQPRPWAVLKSFTFS